MPALGRKQTLAASVRNGWKADLTGLCPLNLYKGEHADPNYVLPGLILGNDELFDSVDAAFQVVSCEVSGRPHGKLLHSLQVGERRAFFIEDALAIHLSVEEVGLHFARSQYLIPSERSLTYLRGDVYTRRSRQDINGSKADATLKSAAAICPIVFRPVDDRQHVASSLDGQSVRRHTGSRGDKIRHLAD